MPNVTVNPINTIKVRVGTTSQPVVTSTSTFVGSSANVYNELQVVFDEANAAYSAANAALLAANSALEYANTKVSKDGDSMTDPLYFVTAVANTVNMTGVGNIQSENGIDLWANTGSDWAQLNYANTNFAYVDGSGAYLQTTISQINAFNDGAIQLQTSNGKPMSILVDSSSVFEVASNNDVFSTGTYFGSIAKVDGGIFS